MSSMKLFLTHARLKHYIGSGPSLLGRPVEAVCSNAPCACVDEPLRVCDRLWFPPDRWRGFGGSFGGASGEGSSLSAAAEATSDEAAAGGGKGAAGERAAAGSAVPLAGCGLRLVDEVGCGLEGPGTRD